MMATTDFTANDIRKAVAETMTPLLGGSERKDLAKSVYGAHKAGAGLMPAFRASIAGGAPPADLEAAFVAAAEKAKAERLAKKSANAAASDATTPEKPPAKVAAEAAKAAKRAARRVKSGVLKQAQRAAKGFEDDESVRDALQLVSDASTATTDAAETAATEAETAASAPDDATAKVAAEAAKDALEAANEAAEEAAEALEDLKVTLADAKEARKAADEASANDPAAKAKGWFVARAIVFGLLGVAAVVTAIAVAIGMPPWLPTGVLVTLVLIAIPAVAIWAGVQAPPAGRNAASVLAIAAIIAVVIAARTGSGNSAESTRSQEEAAETFEAIFEPYPTHTPSLTETPTS